MTVWLCESPCCRPDDDGEPDPRQAAHGLRLCEVCTTLIRRDTARAAELWWALGQAAANTARRGEAVGGRAGTGIVLNDAAVEAADAIRATLVSLCRLIGEERGFALPEDTMIAMARYIVRSAEWLAAHPAAGEHAHDLRDVATDPRTWRLAYPARGAALYIGQCPLSVEGDVCGARLYQRPDDPLVRCPGCGTEDTIEWWQRTIVGRAGGVVDAYAGAAHLAMQWRRPVGPAVIRQWAHRGKLHPLTCRVGEEDQVDRDARGRVRYRLEDLTACALRTWGAPATGRR